MHNGEAILDSVQAKLLTELLKGQSDMETGVVRDFTETPFLKGDKYKIVKKDDDTYRLVVKNVQSSDAGNYNIVTSDQNGRTFDSVNLDVMQTTSSLQHQQRFLPYTSKYYANRSFVSTI